MKKYSIYFLIQEMKPISLTAAMLVVDSNTIQLRDTGGAVTAVFPINSVSGVFAQS